MTDSYMLVLCPATMPNSLANCYVWGVFDPIFYISNHIICMNVIYSTPVTFHVLFDLTEKIALNAGFNSDPCMIVSKCHPRYLV